MKNRFLILLGMTLTAACMTGCATTADVVNEATVSEEGSQEESSVETSEEIQQTEISEETASTEEEQETETDGAELTQMEEVKEQAEAWFATKQYDEVKVQSVDQSIFNGWVKMYSRIGTDEESKYAWKAGISVDDICSQGLYAYSSGFERDGHGNLTYKVNSYEPGELCYMYFCEMGTDEAQGYALAANLTGSECDVDAMTIVAMYSNYSAICRDMDGRSMTSGVSESYFSRYYNDSMPEYTCTEISDYGNIFHFFDIGDGTWWIVEEYPRYEDEYWMDRTAWYIMASYAEKVIEMDLISMGDAENVVEYFLSLCGDTGEAGVNE